MGGLGRVKPPHRQVDTPNEATAWLLALGAHLRTESSTDAGVARRLGLAPQNWHSILAGRRPVSWDAAIAAARLAGFAVQVTYTDAP